VLGWRTVRSLTGTVRHRSSMRSESLGTFFDKRIAPACVALRGGYPSVMQTRGVPPVGDEDHVQTLTWSLREGRLLHRRQMSLFGRDANLQHATMLALTTRARPCDLLVDERGS
jgi:hypothetical protein